MYTGIANDLDIGIAVFVIVYKQSTLRESRRLDDTFYDTQRLNTVLPSC